jgi:hypothetical protein
VIAIIQQSPRRQARFFDNIGKTESHADGKNSMETIGCGTPRKLAIKRAKSSFHI